MSRYVLAIDIGTQSIRALIFNEKGDLVCKSQRPIFSKYITDSDGSYELDADVFWDETVKAVNELKSTDPETFELIEAMSVTTQRDTGILLDSECKPIRNAIIWMDEREVDYKPVNFIHDTAFRIVGMHDVVKNLRNRSQAHWLKVNEPENWEKADKFVLLSAYINYKLTGNLTDSDASLCGHIPFNYKTRKWDSRLGVKSIIFEIEKSKLCSVTPSTELIGMLSKEASEELGIAKFIPVVASGSDKACETIGVGCKDETTFSVSLGSQTTIETTSEKYYELDPFFPPFTSVRPLSYNPEVTIYRGFWMVKWFESEFADLERTEAVSSGKDTYSILNEKLKKIPAGSDGLVLQPYWGVNLTKPSAKGCIIGFSDVHTKIHIYKAIIEGIAYAVLEGVEKIERKSGVRSKSIALSGGGCQSDEICQIAADVLGRDVYRVQTFETSGLGAAVCTFTYLKVYDSFDETVDNMVHVDSVFHPDKNNAILYRKIYERVYTQIYSNLKPVYKQIRKIIKRNRKNEEE